CENMSDIPEARDFIETKLTSLKQQGQKPLIDTKDEDLQRKDRQERYIPRRIVDRLAITNLLHNFSKANSTAIHQPEKCLNCRSRIENVKKKEYIKGKVAQLQSELIDKKVEHTLLTKDSLSRIGELVQMLPNLRKADITPSVEERCNKEIPRNVIKGHKS
ncbi:unnamed protein product, partial [Owenia fusiformis]